MQMRMRERHRGKLSFQTSIQSVLFSTWLLEMKIQEGEIQYLPQSPRIWPRCFRRVRRWLHSWRPWWPEAGRQCMIANSCWFVGEGNRKNGLKRVADVGATAREFASGSLVDWAAGHVVFQTLDFLPETSLGYSHFDFIRKRRERSCLRGRRHSCTDTERRKNKELEVIKRFSL